jgi:hypothetical protein
METQITIGSYTGDPDGADLENCFFRETAHDSGQFLLFGPDQLWIQTEPTPVPNGFQFKFNHGELNWTAAFVYSNTTGVGAGIWSAMPAAHAGDGEDVEGAESGTFQAQAGTGNGYGLETRASVSASA